LHLIERGLVVGIAVHGRHETGLDADRVVEHLDHGSETIGGAGRIRNDDVIFRDLVVIDAIDNGDIRAVRGRRDEHALGAGRQMGCGFFPGREDTRAFECDVDRQFLVRELRRIFDRRDANFVSADDHQFTVDLHLAGEAAVHRIVAQEMGVGFDRPEIVDADDHNVLAPGFQDRT
jgi:hypothetical protein